MKPMRVFVTGTDTGVGKTQAAGALLSLMADRGWNPAPMKPYESGVDDLGKPADALSLIEAAKSRDPLDQVCVHRFRAPVAPGVAAMRERRSCDPEPVRRAFARVKDRSLVVEGAGGLFVPLAPGLDVIDLVAEFRLPVLLVARAGLGTLNHTALSLEALRRRRVPVLAVLLNRTTQERDASERDNPRLIAERHGVRVLGPVGWSVDPARRRSAFRRALRPLFPE